MIQIRKVTIRSLNPSRRRVFLYLPEDYDTSGESYPVLYMFDGENLFFDEDTAYGRSWRMAEELERLHAPVIVCGVESSHAPGERLSELSPFPHNTEELGPVKGRADILVQWLVNYLKPSIDKEFRTLPDREHTFIGGSSMGGLASLYVLSSFPEVFSRAACLSPSLWVQPGLVCRMLCESDYPEGTVIYMNYGSEEVGKHADTFEVMQDAIRILLEKGVFLTFSIIPGASHCEECWGQQIPLFMQSLLQP